MAFVKRVAGLGPPTKGNWLPFPALPCTVSPPMTQELDEAGEGGLDSWVGGNVNGVPRDRNPASGIQRQPGQRWAASTVAVCHRTVGLSRRNEKGMAPRKALDAV